MMVVDHADRAVSKPHPIYAMEDPPGSWFRSFRGRPSHNESIRTQTNPTTPANRPRNTNSESISLPLFSPTVRCDGMIALPPGVDRWWIQHPAGIATPMPVGGVAPSSVGFWGIVEKSRRFKEDSSTCKQGQVPTQARRLVSVSKPIHHRIHLDNTLSGR